MLTIKQFPINASNKALRKIARNYATAIERRGRKATEPSYLAYIWSYRGANFIRDGKNFLVMKSLANTGWFVASHFCPDTLRGGYKLIKKMCDEKLPVIFTVPEDIAKDLERIGWKRIPAWAMALTHKAGVPAEKIVLTPNGMMTAAWKATTKIDWKNLYAPKFQVVEYENGTRELIDQSVNEYRAENLRNRKKPKGKKFTFNREPLVRIADAWPSTM